MPAVPPTSGALRVTPVSVEPTAQMLRPVGTASSRSRDSTCCCVALFTSTTGESPVTVTVTSNWSLVTGRWSSTDGRRPMTDDESPTTNFAAGITQSLFASQGLHDVDGRGARRRQYRCEHGCAD